MENLTSVQEILPWFWQKEGGLGVREMFNKFRAHKQQNLSRETCQGKLVDRTHEKVNLSRKTC
jgi:hypothetical protein